MDLRRLRPGEWVLTVAAIALAVSLFLPWFGSLDAWQAFSVVDVVLVLCVAAVALAVGLQATQDSPALPVIGSVLAGWAALVAFVLTLIKVLDGTDVRYGAWIALAATVGLAAGAWWAIRDDSPGLGVGKSHLESSG